MSKSEEFVISVAESDKVRASFEAAGKTDSVALYDAVMKSLDAHRASGLELARDYAKYFEYVRPDFGTDAEVAQTCGFSPAKSVQLVRVGRLLIKGGRIPDGVSFSELAEITAARKTWDLSQCEEFLANFAGKRTCSAIRAALKAEKAAEKAAGQVKVAAETMSATRPETVIDGHAVEVMELPAEDTDVSAVLAALSGHPEAQAAFDRLRDKYGF